MALYLMFATDLSGMVLFGVWPLAMLVLLACRRQASNRGVAQIAGTIAAGIVTGCPSARRLPCLARFPSCLDG